MAFVALSKCLFADRAPATVFVPLRINFAALSRSTQAKKPRVFWISSTPAKAPIPTIAK